MKACKTAGLVPAIMMSFMGAAIAVAVSNTQAQSGDNPHAEILSIGGSVTEIVYALGQEHRLVARDTTSVYPPEAHDLPDVGYMRALSPEGVLAVDPAMILSEEGAGPPETIDVLKSADIPFITVPLVRDGAGIAQKIRVVGHALGVSEEADALAEDVQSKMDAARERASEMAGTERKRVLFVLSTQGGRILASGSDTAADAIIRLAGADNAVTEFEGYKPMTDEAVSRAQPDVILMMDRTDDHGADNRTLFSMPALSPTPAARNDAVVRMNGLYLLGFGPRTAEAVTELSETLYTP
ncbi:MULTISPECIES: hemin ABC transporter substrate-binding protein [unclassified Roseovarius]|uniref:heme/hemin ABC transporter substrate-binding protein n=1 Tax=unclassified Roseovarius TaxID=2614913 RepID=UPI00273E189D|nr:MULTISPECIES: ABC transporter substrate-binding protein [unclassified Roseovarius]